MHDTGPADWPLIPLDLLDMASDTWSPATRDHAEMTIKRIKEASSVKEGDRILADWKKFYKEHPECLF